MPGRRRGRRRGHWGGSAAGARPSVAEGAKVSRAKIPRGVMSRDERSACLRCPQVEFDLKARRSSVDLFL